MKLASVRNVIAILFALVIAGGSVAGAGSAKDSGMGTQPVLNGGAADYGDR